MATNPSLVRAKEGARIPKFNSLSYDDVEYIHLRLVEDFATSPDPIEPAGIRDPNLLHSAIGRLTSGFGGRSKYRTIDGLAASLFYGVCQNHAFHNGNKRTAVVALLSYLDRNGRQLETSEDELYNLVTSLAAHELCGKDAAPDREVGQVRQWIRARIRQTEKGEQPLRFHEFRSILVSFGCTLESPRASFIMLRRTVDGRKLHRKLPYHGETKELDPGYIRMARTALELDDDHGVDSKVFYRAALRPDEFITRYRTLLRNLANV